MVDGLRRALGFLTVYPLRASDAWTPETLRGSPVDRGIVGIQRGSPMALFHAQLGYGRMALHLEAPLARRGGAGPAGEGHES